MKKIILALAFVFCTASVTAQGFGIGGRIGSGFQAQAEYTFNNDNYIDGRFGMSWCNRGAEILADLTLLYQWNIAKMDWTPRAGEWFFDAGIGASVGGKAHYAYVGVTGGAKFGIQFNGAPIKLAIDWTPVVGPSIVYGGGKSHATFNEFGLVNFGLSCVYCF